MPVIAIIVLVLGILLILAGLYLIKSNKDKAEKIGNAEEKARNIIDEALKAAETKKREGLLELKEETLRNKNELERESKERRSELQKFEKRVLAKEEALDRKADSLEKRESQLTSREDKLNKRQAEVDALSEKRVQELERISGLTSEQAKDYLLKTVEDEVKHETAMLVKELETRAKEEAGKKAKEYVVTAIQKCAADHVAETTISVVPLPNDEMKGRIIGREGRNIRAIEQATGVDLIIDDTPDVITVSCFDPIRREIARQSLEILMKDGRIQPGRIEEVINKVTKELDETIFKIGNETVYKLGIGKMNRELIRLVGRLRFRYSYGQNGLEHSIEVANFAGMMAAELGLNQVLAKRAGLLHDIGKAVDFEQEGSHVELGAKFAKKYGENPIIVNAIESHHGDTEATDIIAVLVAAADTISAARPGARYESMEGYIERLENLEKIATSFDGVEKAFAIQAGREIRIMVQPEKIDDITMVKVAHDIREKIENELTYPGQIKVTLIREVRVQELAK